MHNWWRNPRTPRPRKTYGGLYVGTTAEPLDIDAIRLILPSELQDKAIKLVNTSWRKHRKLSSDWRLHLGGKLVLFGYEPPGGMTSDEIEAETAPFRNSKIFFCPIPWFDDPVAVAVIKLILAKTVAKAAAKQ